jgi:hypothetical protein
LVQFNYVFAENNDENMQKVISLENRVNNIELQLQLPTQSMELTTNLGAKVKELAKRTNNLSALLLNNASFNFKGGYKFTYVGEIGEKGILKGQFVKPTAITGDTQNLFIADTGNNRIVKYNIALKTFDLFEDLPENFFSLDSPTGILLYKGNVVLVSDSFNNRIVAYNYDGQYKVQYGELGISKAQFDNPQGIAVDVQGNLFIADANNNRIQAYNFDFVKKFDQENFKKSYLKSFGEDKLNHPTYLAVLANGDVLVSDTKNNSLKLYDAFANYKKDFFVLNNGSSILGTPLGIKEDSEKNIYLIDNQNKRLIYFNKNQEILGILDAYLEDPIDLFINGNLLYIVDRDLNKILIFRRDVNQ